MGLRGFIQQSIQTGPRLAGVHYLRHALNVRFPVRIVKRLPAPARRRRGFPGRPLAFFVIDCVRALVEFAEDHLSGRGLQHAGDGHVDGLGIAPNRIDLLTSLTGVTFEEAWERRVPGDLGGVPTVFLSRETLIKNKRATGRT